MRMFAACWNFLMPVNVDGFDSFFFCGYSGRFGFLVWHCGIRTAGELLFFNSSKE